MINLAVRTLVLLSLSCSVFGQDEDERVRSSKPIFVYLTIGIDSDEKLQTMPAVISFKGTFRRLVQASYSKELNSIRFTPKAEGEATFTIHDGSGKLIADYRLIVQKSKLDAVLKQMQSLLADIEGIQLKIINNKVVVDGQILLPNDMSRIYSVVSQFGEQAASLVSLSPLAQKKIAEFIFRSIGNPEIEVRAVNNKIILEGWAESDDEKARAEVIAKLHVPPLLVDKAVAEGVLRPLKPANDGVVNLIKVKAGPLPPPPKTIQIVTHYVELQKDYQRSFRFQFMPNLTDGSQLRVSSGDGANPDNNGTQFTAIIDQLLPKLNWSKQHGHARILESTTLIVQDGKKGTLNSVQEVPYQTISSGTGGGVPTTSFKEVGIATSITPAVVEGRSDSINMIIEFQISAITGLSQAGPRTTKNVLNTEIIVRSGQSAAIGGLIKSGSTTGYNKFPQSAPENPIVSLYASREFQKNQSQFVVFVTPIIKSSASAGSEKIKKKFKLRN
jgi:pilus assembly protein CpaC